MRIKKERRKISLKKNLIGMTQIMISVIFLKLKMSKLMMKKLMMLLISGNLKMEKLKNLLRVIISRKIKIFL